MRKQQILQKILHTKGRHTIGKIPAADVCRVTGIDKSNLNKYSLGLKIPSDKQFTRILDACEKIAQQKYDFILRVKREGRED